MRFSISRSLGLGFAGKCDDIGRAQRFEAWTAREMIDFTALIPPHNAIAGRDRWYLSGSSRCQMTCSLREHICEAIPCQHDAAFGEGLDGRDVVNGKDLSILLILTAAELPVTVGLLFRHAKALLSGPSLKTSFRQFRQLRSGMVRL